MVKVLGIAKDRRKAMGKGRKMKCENYKKRQTSTINTFILTFFVRKNVYFIQKHSL